LFSLIPDNIMSEKIYGSIIVSEYPLLLSPIRIGNLVLSNRIVMPPMFTNLSDGQGDVTQAHIGHYEKRPGPGLVIVENAAVLPEGRLNTRQLGIYADRHIKGLSALAKIIHANGSAAGIQIHHAGMLSLSKEMEDPRRRRITIAGRFFRQQFAGPGLMKIREAFQAAARRALEAGFDIVVS